MISSRGENSKRAIKIAFVCTGNTCRSPIAQFILRDKLKRADEKGVLVKSFGIRAKRSPMNENAVLALTALNVPFRKFTSKPIPKSLSFYDLVVCMTEEHFELLKDFCPSATTFDRLFNSGDVADPYGKDLETYIKTARLLSDNCEKLCEMIIGYKRRDSI